MHITDAHGKPSTDSEQWWSSSMGAWADDIASSLVSLNALPAAMLRCNQLDKVICEVRPTPSITHHRPHLACVRVSSPEDPATDNDLAPSRLHTHQDPQTR